MGLDQEAKSAPEASLVLVSVVVSSTDASSSCSSSVFLSTTTAYISRHRSRPSSFADFHSSARLARKSNQLSAILLTLLVLKVLVLSKGFYFSTHMI